MALALATALMLFGCTPATPMVREQTAAPLEMKSAEPSEPPTLQPAVTPPAEALAPKKIRLRVVDSFTRARPRCWKSVLGEKYRSTCGVVYSVTVTAAAKTEGTVVIKWNAKLFAHDSCCGDRTLGTFYRKMNTPKVVSGDPEFLLVNKWDGYPVEKSPSIDNYFIPTGFTSGTFAYWRLDEGEAETVTFSIVFDDGGGGYMSSPYPLEVTILGDGKELVSFTRDRKD